FLVVIVFRKRILVESFFMISWFIWTIISSSIVDPYLFNESYFPPVFRFATISVFLFFLFNSINIQYSANDGFKAIWLGGLIILILTIGSGGVQAASSLYGERIGTDIMWNANDYAYMLLISTFSIIYFLASGRSVQIRLLNSLFLLLITGLIILSASRKAFLTEVVFILGSFVIGYFFEVRKRLVSILMKASFIIAFVITTSFLLTNTYLGERLGELWTKEVESRTFDERFLHRGRYYVEALDVIREFPIMGVGLDNFKYYDKWREPAHSDFVAVITETGIVGFLLYFCAYAVIIGRLIKSLHSVQRSEERRQISFQLLIVASILLMALARWNYNHPLTNIILATIGRISYERQGRTNEIRNRRYLVK
ncbi:MAG: O-antigen ligase family protein, partial [Deltaproteobacteria bacterium]|nr:O-antigen ligase family protein [Deltaproteobacteria bacterium]